MENIFFMVFAKTLADLKIMRTFAPAIERESVGRETIKIILAQWLSWLERRPVTAKVESSSLFWVVSIC